MSLRSGLILMLALVLGGSAAVSVNRYVTRGASRPSGGRDTVPVVVAVADVPRGASLTADLVKVRDYPREIRPEGVLARVEDALGRTVFIPMVKGEPVVDAKLAPKGAKRGLAALVPSGMRAFTIHTPSVASGVAGFVLPGNSVDVLLTVDGGRGSTTSTLLQNLEILAVDQRIDAPADNRVDPNQLRSVTLLVTPDQAARLGLAQNKGSLHLSLRNPQDDRHVDTLPARLSELEGSRDDALTETVARLPARPAVEPGSRPEPEPEPARPTPPPRFVTVYRGVRSVERYPIGDLPPLPRPIALESRVDEPGMDTPR